MRRSRPSVASEEKSRRWTSADSAVGPGYGGYDFWYLCATGPIRIEAFLGLRLVGDLSLVLISGLFAIWLKAEQRVLAGRGCQRKLPSVLWGGWRRTSWRAWLDEGRVGKHFFVCHRILSFPCIQFFPEAILGFRCRGATLVWHLNLGLVVFQDPHMAGHFKGWHQSTFGILNPVCYVSFVCLLLVCRSFDDRVHKKKRSQSGFLLKSRDQHCRFSLELPVGFASLLSHYIAGEPLVNFWDCKIDGNGFAGSNPYVRLGRLQVRTSAKHHLIFVLRMTCVYQCFTGAGWLFPSSSAAVWLTPRVVVVEDDFRTTTTGGWQ